MNPIAITLGDPGGIGPEVALKAVVGRRWPAAVRFVLVGNRALAARQAADLRLPCPPAWQPESASQAGRMPGPVVVWDPAGGAAAALRGWRPGAIGKTQGRAAAQWIRAAAHGCRGGLFAAMVTGPICKQSLRLAGLSYPGHTEFLAALTGTRRFAMMLLGGPLRVVLVTRHLPLASVPGALSRVAIAEAVRLAAQALPWLGTRQRTIGVCALNPHAGDGGVLGTEERTLIGPALRALRRAGLDVAGPVPGDAIFHQAVRGRYGAVVAMYHDQGLGPLKMLAFEEGVNLTLGLPIVRTSPDHGTAFDLAGKGRANPGSMAAAIRLAIRLAGRLNPWRSL